MVWETYGLIHDSRFREVLEIHPGEKVVGSLHVGVPFKIPNAQARIPVAGRMTTFDKA